MVGDTQGRVMFGLFAAILLYKSVRPSLRCIHGAVGMINVRGEFSTAAKNATKKRHRLPPSPSFVSTPLSTLLFFKPTEIGMDRQRAFVRSFVRSFVWVFVVRQSKYCPVTALVTNHAAAEGFMLMARRRCAVERDQRARTLPNRAPISVTAAAGSGAQFVIPMTKSESVMPPSPTTSRVRE